MYRAVLLSLGLALVVSVHSEGMRGCGGLLKGGASCCNKELGMPAKPPQQLKECFQMMKKPPSCNVDICIAQKSGYASSDGTLDKNAFVEILEKDFEKNPELAENIKDNCVNGDLSKYGNADFCDLWKLKTCIDVQVVKNCDDWKDDGECKGAKDLAAECTKQFD